MSQTINVNGESINYPETGDTNWGDEATQFAIQTSAALGKIGLSSGTTVDIAQTLDVTGATTLDSTLTVSGTTTLNGTANLNGNNNLGNASGDTTAITGILNVDSGVLYVDPTTNKVGINDTTPSVELDVNGSVAITGNETVGGTLGVSGNTTVGGVTYLDDDTTANTPVLSFTGDTNTGIGRSAADTLDFITNGNPRFRIESTGQIKAVYESSLGTDYNTTLHNGYFCRAWVNFDGTSSNLTGTYSRTGTTITVSITSHGLTSGQSVYLDFTTGAGTDGIYIVTVVDANSYTVTDTVSGSTSGNVTQFRYIRASGNVSSITDNGVGCYVINFTTAMPDINYSYNAINNQTSAFTPIVTVANYNRVINNIVAPTVNNLSISCLRATDGSNVYDPEYVYVEVIR